MQRTGNKDIVTMKEFIYDLLPESFKGMTKEYMIACIENPEIQRNWNPSVGDVIVGKTGNVFVISGHHKLVPELGGDKFFFGGGSCNRDGGHIMDSTFCYVLNKDGMNYCYGPKGIEQRKDTGYSSFDDFRYVPYPHETSETEVIDDYTHIPWKTPKVLYVGMYVQLIEANDLPLKWQWWQLREYDVDRLNKRKDLWAKCLRIPVA